jgi:lycopene beta-cyclase
MPSENPDLIILGGGLAGGLITLALAARRPEFKVTIVEAGEALGGNHVWSFFDTDVADADRPLVEPLIGHRWPAYDVRFPGHSRTIDQPYNSIESEHFDRVVRAALPADAIIRAVVADATSTSVTFADGRTLTAKAVIDTRGAGDLAELRCGWQKFLGQTLHLEAPHCLTRPVVMDAIVDQSDGYRFVYLLPFGPSEIFVEDTYYSDTPDLDAEALKQRIADYAAAQGWAITRTSRTETGVLPVVIGGDFDAYWPAADGVARGGVRAGLFQPLTSYSLPDAVRFASWLAEQPNLTGSALAKSTRKYSRRQWRRNAYYRMLGMMLFRAADPPHRYRILERFYRLSPALIGRFYAGQSTLGDKVRILSGRPPVPLGRAVKALLERT